VCGVEGNNGHTSKLLRNYSGNVRSLPEIAIPQVSVMDRSAAEQDVHALQYTNLPILSVTY